MSNSGSNTEPISACIDYHAKGEVKNIKSYVEYSPHMLCIFEEENNGSPKPEGSFPVIVDVVGLYTNIPAERDDGGLYMLLRELWTKE